MSDATQLAKEIRQLLDQKKGGGGPILMSVDCLMMVMINLKMELQSKGAMWIGQ